MLQSHLLLIIFAILISLLSTLASLGSSNPAGAIFNNAALHPAADPYTLYDKSSGLYYSYSTSGQDPNWLFAIYTSPDLSTWKKVPGGAMQACINNGTSFQSGQMCWAKDWQWAPEVYHNAKTGWYFLFVTGRLRPDLRKYYFQYSDFEEASKLGVAVSRSPKGPFIEIEPNPIDYHPFDPYYHDVNLIMDLTQKLPPRTQREGKKAPRGSYIPSIDPNLYFSPNAEEIYLYFSRTAYRNWIWDVEREKYIEESGVVGVQMSTDWWNDPDAKTMPRIATKEMDRYAEKAWPLPENITAYNATGEIGYPPRKDGWTPIITYQNDPQAWENDSVNDYLKSNGSYKDRRFAEASTVISRKKADGSTVYLVTYSANFFASENYGVGVAISKHPLGPFRKSRYNPVLTETFNTGTPIVSTGHGSIVASRTPETAIPGLLFQSTDQGEVVARDDQTESEEDTQRVMYETPTGSELFYIHHARNSTQAERALYTTRLTLQVDKEEEDNLEQGVTIRHFKMHLTAADQPFPRGTTPITISMKDKGNMTCAGKNILVELRVLSASGAPFELAEASNRVVLRNDESLDLSPLYSTLLEDERTTLVLFRRSEEKQQANFVGSIVYQRHSSKGVWEDVVGSPLSCS